MKNKYQFSLAQRININISGAMSKDCCNFIELIYKNFDKTLENPTATLNVELTDVLPKIESKIQLGKDGYADDNTLILNSGHSITRIENGFNIKVPSKVKRGKIPFKRTTPGRHITDEIIEPFLQLLLLDSDATFVHASSVYENEEVKVLMGWRGTGKTNAILKDFDSKEIWSDDLAIIDTDGFVYPYLRPIRLYSYNLPLLNEDYLRKHKLNFKKRITPPWQPVHYLPLETKSNHKKAKLKKINYLNNPKSLRIGEDAEEIMHFEQLFFEDFRIMLKHLGIYETNNSVADIVNKALTSK